jgi:hypothetical protein
MTYAQALQRAGVVTDRPDNYVPLVEYNLGRMLERAGLADILDYLR